MEYRTHRFFAALDKDWARTMVQNGASWVDLYFELDKYVHNTAYDLEDTEAQALALAGITLLDFDLLCNMVYEYAQNTEAKQQELAL